MAHKHVLFRSAAREKIHLGATALTGKLHPQELGKAKPVVNDRENTTLIGGGGAKDANEARCAELRKQIQTTTSDYDREKLKEPWQSWGCSTPFLQILTSLTPKSIRCGRVKPAGAGLLSKAADFRQFRTKN